MKRNVALWIGSTVLGLALASGCGKEDEVCGEEQPYDGVDNDCDSLTPDDDLDGDGSPGALDCDDANSAAYPGAADTVGDGVDQSCDGVDGTDADLDGAASVESGGQDCDDGDAAVYPGGADTAGDGVDANCDGVDGEDADGDGVASEYSGGEDCDDANDAVYPGAPELCGDGVRNDCAATQGEALTECGLGGVVDGSAAGARLVGEATGDRAGSAVAIVGDVDGDGYDDVMVGAEYASFSGAVYLVRGPISGTLGLSAADHAMIDWTSSQAGRAIGGAGDVNADGLADILIGDEYDNTFGVGSGIVYLIHGPVTTATTNQDVAATLVGGNRGYLGSAVSSAGDVNADGYEDILIGARYSYTYLGGAVYLFLGPVRGNLYASSADSVFTAESNGVEAGGHALTSLGDANGDGLDDFAVGAPIDTYELEVGDGKVYLLYDFQAGNNSLSAADAVLLGSHLGALGKSAANAGDLDGDGLDDLVVGENSATHNSTLGGAAHVVYGGVTGTHAVADVAAATVFGEADYSLVGYRVAGVGDVSQDGFLDVVIGCMGCASVSYDSIPGSALLYLGPIAGTLSPADAQMEIRGDEGDRLGQSIAGGGDLNADGIADFLIGARDADTGVVYAFFGGGL